MERENRALAYGAPGRPARPRAALRWLRRCLRFCRSFIGRDSGGRADLRRHRRQPDLELQRAETQAWTEAALRLEQYADGLCAARGNWRGFRPPIAAGH